MKRPRSLVSEMQDTAAGGHDRRIIVLGNGRTAVASVAVRKLPGNRELYGYLQFRAGRHNVTKYIGNVTAASHQQSLQIGWKLVRSKKLINRVEGRWLRE